MIAATVFMTMSGFVYSVGLALCIVFFLNAWRRRRLRRGLPLPPGPTGLPLVGSIFDVDLVQPWISYEQWGKQYGGLVYANLVGKDFIIINSAKVAHDLLDRRSTIYSDRPYLQASEWLGVNFTSVTLPYGDKWRLHRRVYNTVLSKRKANQYAPLAIRKARQLVESLLDTPEDHVEHCKIFSIAIIMGATYGYEVAPKNDRFVTRVGQLGELCQETLTAEWVALLLAFPFLAHIPPWFPGGGYKLKAAKARALAQEVLTLPVEYVTKEMATGTAGESIVRDLIETQDDKVDDDTIKAVAATTFMAGSDTTSGVVQVFLLAMVLHPEVQDKALEEISRVVGSGRLPNPGDRPNLPYVEAICLETHRWQPVTPSAISHMTSTSDVYEGMYIPKGAIILPNVWAIGHDETQFDDPMAFIPERHLTSTGVLAEGTAHYAFGFGRRICAGRYIADESVWAAVVTILATVHVAKARDEFGKEIDVKAEFTSGSIVFPKPFSCSFTPRFPRGEDLIRMKNDNGE